MCICICFSFLSLWWIHTGLCYKIELYCLCSFSFTDYKQEYLTSHFHYSTHKPRKGSKEKGTL